MDPLVKFEADLIKQTILTQEQILEKHASLTKELRQKAEEVLLEPSLTQVELNMYYEGTLQELLR